MLVNNGLKLAPKETSKPGSIDTKSQASVIYVIERIMAGVEINASLSVLIP